MDIPELAPIELSHQQAMIIRQIVTWAKVRATSDTDWSGRVAQINHFTHYEAVLDAKIAALVLAGKDRAP